MSRAPPTIAFACATALSAACAGLSDLRTPPLLDGISEDEAARGRALLASSIAAHGGREAWAASGVARYRITDTWPSAITRAAAMPWPQSPQRTELLVETGKDNARLTFIDGSRAGEALGVQGWATYSVVDEQLAFADDERTRFWVPTLVYFLELPFRLAEAEIVADAGPLTHGGREYQRVFATWRAAAPQPELDQYVLWIDGATGRVAFVEYTIRDWAGFLRGGMQYEGELLVDGIVFPKRLSARSELGADDVLHIIEVERVDVHVDVSPTVLMPDRARARSKHPRP